MEVKLTTFGAVRNYINLPTQLQYCKDAVCKSKLWSKLNGQKLGFNYSLKFEKLAKI